MIRENSLENGKKTPELIGVIAAAGPGTRLYPESKRKSKVLLRVDGRSLISRNVHIMASELGLRKIAVIAGPNMKDVKDELSKTAPSGSEITFIENTRPETGLAEGVLLARSCVRGPFCLMLGDEFYLESNLKELRAFFNEKEFSAVCAVRKGANPGDIRKNYAVTLKGDLLDSLTEKPVQVANDLLGCGTFLFTEDIFGAIERTAVSERSGKRELIDAVNILIREGKKVYPHFLEGGYVNVNTADDLNQAGYLARARLFGEKRISLVIPAYNEEDSIGHVIDDFKGAVHEIVVADNMSSDRTAHIAREKGAFVYSENMRGYGHALRVGMEKATGEILVLTEADGSFKARDLGKLLEYLKDADMVLGTRTTEQMIQQGANMNLFLRLGNVAVAKIIEILWWSRHEPRLTDVGCTFRAVWADAYRRMKKDLKADGPSFSPEMIIEPIRRYMRVIEIPVSYHGRIGGESKHSGNLGASVKTGLSMLALIIRKRIGYFVTDDLVPWLKRKMKTERTDE
jgi:dTDP-glucose pyrophosphorylase